MSTPFPLYRILKPESFWNPLIKDDDIRYEVIAEAASPYTDAEIKAMEETHGDGLVQETGVEYY